MAKEKPFGIKLLIFLLFIGGLAFNLLIVSDVALGWWLQPPKGNPPPAPPGTSRQAALPKSVVLVWAFGCTSGGGNGTGFVVAPGYVVTAAHVVADSLRCGQKVLVVDMNHRQFPASVEGHSAADDLALLKIADESLPPLALADSQKYFDSDEMIKIFTLGYPLLGSASSPGKASFSGTGSISKYENELKRFVTSNLNLNPGNSGGPVILADNNQVVGVALAVLTRSGGHAAAGIGYAVPAAAVERLYRERTGKGLR